MELNNKEIKTTQDHQQLQAFKEHGVFLKNMGFLSQYP
jgi:hypothetical protein